ncbi:MAG: hypothetical protein GC131_06930 [Alphaproteobacteria bacterium]|nr:hypothetical protein [Alphaproteobacteria bacterium]
MMADNEDDFEEQAAGFEESMEEPVLSEDTEDGGAGRRERMMANVSEAWRTQPFFKLVVVMIVVAAVIASIMSLTSSPNTPVPSRVASTPDLREAPGGTATPAFIEAQKQAAAQRAAAAQKTGGSAMPTPVGTGISLDDLENKDENEGDKLAEFRDELARMKQQQKVQVQQIQQQVKQQRPEQFDDKLSQAMRSQMNQLLEGWQPKQLQLVSGTSLKDELKAKDDAGKDGGKDAPETAAPPSTILVPAGTVNYGQMLTEANSDVPGPILAQILSGPLAGARAVGSFKYFEEYLVLTFNLISYKGKDYSVNALALDPESTLGGLATEVDHRYFTRVILPAAAAFARGIGRALAQGGSTTTINNDTTLQEQGKKSISQGVYEGLSEAGETVGTFLQQKADATKTLVRVASGAPIGIFFVESVTDRAPEPPSYAPYAGGYYNGAVSQGGYAPQAGYAPPGSAPAYQAGANVTNYPQPGSVPVPSTAPTNASYAAPAP